MQTAQVIPFRFDAREVRTLLIDDQPWFCAADVCDALGYANSRKAISDNCREAGVTASDISSGGQKRRVTFINEGNLYRLIIKSRKEEAQRFESWVCDEVLPAIRKHGRYVDESGKLDSLVGAVIGTSGVLVLDRVIEQKASPIPSGMRRSFKHTMKSRLRSRFNVQRADLIPADQLADACNFVAAYAIEGEFLGKEAPADHTLGEEDLAFLYSFCANAMDLVAVGEKLRPALGALSSITLMNVPKSLENCRLVVGHLHDRFGSWMESAARKHGLFVDWINLAAAKDCEQPIYVGKSGGMN